MFYKVKLRNLSQLQAQHTTKLIECVCVCLLPSAKEQNFCTLNEYNKHVQLKGKASGTNALQHSTFSARCHTHTHAHWGIDNNNNK